MRRDQTGPTACEREEDGRRGGGGHVAHTGSLNDDRIHHMTTHMDDEETIRQETTRLGDPLFVTRRVIYVERGR